MPWTFHPVDEAAYAVSASRVLLVGLEPNGEADGPEALDMGHWFRHAPVNNFWNRGGRNFCQRSVQAAERAIAAVVGPGYVPVAAQPLIGALAPGGDWSPQLLSILQHVRFVDWKATPGGAIGMAVHAVLGWMDANADDVAGLFAPIPHVMVFLGGNSHQVAYERRTQLIAANPALAAVPCVCLPHPSAQVSMAALAGLQIGEHLRAFGAAPWRKWSYKNGWTDYSG